MRVRQAARGVPSSPDGPMLVFTPDEWRSFATGSQTGERGTANC
ncbi:MAG: DUF397 domain-containing protein [Streptosporangiaceae bacterium]